ncbi:MAG: ribonuclease VapC [Pyrobaculum sp. OCT_11]|jgi:Predicted nucleic acid-binding protein, contains PIN domain|nr:MAG: ribonuclease VapC [Pyrobaculum sp. OCT_11]
MLVIDASALAALLMPEDGGEEVEKAVKEAERVSTLDLAAYEVGNAVWRRVRRGELSMEEGNVVVSTLLSLLETFEIFSYREVAADAFRLAVDAGITVYDAAYVVLAKRLDARLLTLDGELLRKFPDVTYAPL